MKSNLWVMRILLLGGTSFVGRHVALAAIAAGHDVTFANRGVTNPNVFADHPHVRFDRSGDATILETIDADVVIDTSGYAPDSVLASARTLAGRVRKYVFMSSIDAYDMHAPSIDEGSPTKRLAPADSTADRVPELYGAHKVRCEELLIERFGAEHVLNIRAGLMMGPYDNTDRFTYWPARVRLGGDILVPESRAMPVQVIDARDMAQFIVAGLASNLYGTFSVVGDPLTSTFGDVLDACEHVANGAPLTYEWATAKFLEEHDVGPWVEMPLWFPALAELRGLRNISNARARARGLHLRPLADSIRDILVEFDARPTKQLRAGLSAQREATLLRALRAASPAEA